MRNRPLMLLSFAGALALAACDDKNATPTAPTPPTAAPPSATPPAAAPPAANPPAATPPMGAQAPAGAPAAGGAPGAIKGVVKFDGKAPALPKIVRTADAYCSSHPKDGKEMADPSILVHDGKLKNVLVRITNAPAGGAVPTEKATITQHECMYEPRVQGAVGGQEIEIKNGDQTMHNVHTFKGTASWFNNAQIAGSAPIDKKLPSDGSVVVKFKCDVHPWMTGYVIVQPSAFFAVTGENGEFEIKNVPPGKYTVEAWHEKLGQKTAEITVAAGAPAAADFAFKDSDAK